MEGRNNTGNLSGRQLMVRFGHLGDVVLTTGVLYWLGETRGSYFHVLTGNGWGDVFAGHPYVDGVISLPVEDMNAFALSRAFGEIAREHKGRGLLDLHGNLRARLLRGLWQGPVFTYPKMSLERRLFLAGLRARYSEKLRRVSVPERYALAAADTPPPVKELRPRIFLSNEESNRGKEWLTAIFGASVAPVALHPYATHPLKAWPAKHYRRLAALLEEEGIPFVCIGKGEPLFPGTAYDLTNRAALRETCAVLAHCRALVTGDSGPMHLAAAVKTPAVALFGPTTREWGFYPLGERDIVLERELSCRPCSLHGGASCPRNGECLSAITPEEVVAVLKGA